MSGQARLLVAVFLLIPLSLWLIPRATRWVAIDRCLDSGGRWEEARRQCEGPDSSSRRTAGWSVARDVRARSYPLNGQTAPRPNVIHLAAVLFDTPHMRCARRVVAQR